MRPHAGLTSKLESPAWYARRRQLDPEFPRRMVSLRVTSKRRGPRHELLCAEVRRCSGTRASGGATALSALDSRCLEVPGTIGRPPRSWSHDEPDVETGTANERSSLTRLLALHEVSRKQPVSINIPHAKNHRHDWVGCAVVAYLWPRRELVQLPDSDVLRRALRGSRRIDLFHYRSDKSYPGSVFGHSRAWEHLRSGGVLMSEAFEDNFAFRESADSVGEPAFVPRKSVKAGHFAGVV